MSILHLRLNDTCRCALHLSIPHAHATPTPADKDPFISLYTPTPDHTPHPLTRNPQTLNVRAQGIEALKPPRGAGGRVQVKELDDENGDELLEDEEAPKVVLFRSPGQLSGEFIALKEAAAALKHRFNFFAVQPGTNERLEQFVGLQSSADPQRPWLYVFRIDKSVRYRFEGDDMTSPSALLEWLRAFEADGLAPYLMSEQPPSVDAERSALVKTVVGNTFAEFANQDKHVVVDFYAPWCGQCRRLEQSLQLVATYLQAKFPDEFVFGKMDGTKNEVSHLDGGIEAFPTVWLFPKGKKEPPYPIDLSRESADPHLLVKALRLACDKPKQERQHEAAYVAAATRFKHAVRALEGSLQPAVAELNEAAERLEKLAGPGASRAEEAAAHDEL